jgi:hypothetical protein
MSRELVAIHEAAHAAVALAVGLSPLSIKIEPTQGEAGTVAGLAPFDDTSATREQIALVYLAGRAAQLHAGADDRGCIKDMEFVRELEVPGFYQLEAEARRLVAANWPAINAVAAELLLRGTLTGREVRSIWRAA